MNSREKIINPYYKNIIIFISLIFAYFVGEGFYGYGNDFYAVYSKSNLEWGGFSDYLGWRISTLQIIDKHLGVHLSTFIVTLSCGFLLQAFFQYKKKFSTFFFIFIYLILIHTWPIIMSTSNAMRQGLSMSFIFFSLAHLLKHQIIRAFILIFFSIFLHKSGIFYLFTFVSMIFAKSIIIYIKDNFSRVIIYFISGIVINITTILILATVLNLDETQRIIAGDYRFHFLILNLFFIFFYTFRHDLINFNYVNLYLYFFSFLAPALFFSGLNWQYERLNMMMIIPYILVISLLFEKKNSYIFLSLVSLFLLTLTIVNGMYASLK